MLKTTGRLLLAHWPALVAWFLAGQLAGYLLLEGAGFVAAYAPTAGLLLVPLGILAQLISFVAMFLVLRDGLPELQRLSPRPTDARERRREFLDALLGGILPFFAVYAAWGYLRNDMSAYAARALEVRSGIGWTELAEKVERGDLSPSEAVAGPDYTGFALEPLTIVILVLAFAARWALKRSSERVPRWMNVVSVYLEAVWVFLTVSVIADLLGQLGGWVDSRQAIAWLADARQWLAEHLLAITWVWEAIEWFLGELGGVVLLPIAWLTIAGVLYGQAVAAAAPQLSSPTVQAARGRWARLPGGVRRRLADLWDEFAGRFRPIGRVLVLMWRAGPLLIGGYILLYTVVLALQQLLRLGLTRALGPNEFYSFWLVADAVILLIVPLVIEPLRIAFIGGAYDAVLGRLRSADASALTDPNGDLSELGEAGAEASGLDASGLDDESREGRDQVDALDVDREGADGVSGHQVGHDDREGVRRVDGA